MVLVAPRIQEFNGVILGPRHRWDVQMKIDLRGLRAPRVRGRRLGRVAAAPDRARGRGRRRILAA